MKPRADAEVVVVGAGPAGSAVAAELASRGRDVLLLDRASFPRAKACGECLNPGAAAALERLGLLAPVLETQVRSLKGWTLATRGGRRVFARFPAGLRALGVDRRSLDATLLGCAIARGVRFMGGCRVVEVDPGGARRRARVRGIAADGTPFTITGSILVGADGLRSAVARGTRAVRAPAEPRKASLTWRLAGRGPEPDRGRLYLGDGLTVGLAPVPNPRLSANGPDLWNATVVVASARDRAALRKDGEAFLDRGMDVLGPGWIGGFELVDGPWASGPFSWPARGAVVGRTVLVGDAAGYYDPLTGQGMFRALRGAELAAHAIDEALTPSLWKGDDKGAGSTPRARSFDGQALLRYDREHSRAFRPGRLMQRIIEGVVSRPNIREPVFALLERSPRAATALVRLIGDATVVP